MNHDIWCPSCKRRILADTEINKELYETLLYCSRCKTEFVFAKFGVYAK